MNKAYGIMMAFALMGMCSMDHNSPSRRHWDELSDDDKKHIDRIRSLKRIQMMKAKGMREFHTEVGIILALNQKNADRKAKNIITKLKEMEESTK